MKTEFKKLLIAVFSIIAILTCCKNQNNDKPVNDEKPIKYTEINLDQIKDSVILNLELIWDSSFPPDNRALHIPKNRDEYTEYLRCLIPGPDSCFYGLDTKYDKIIKFSANGEYLKTIGGSGSGPGEFLWPGWMYSYSNKFIYVYDKNNGRFQMLDFYGKYIKDFKNITQSMFSEFFCVTKRKEFITKREWSDSLLLNRYDSLGRFINKFGYHPFPKYKTELKRMVSRIIILDSKNEDYIYCIFMDFPIIRKYDYEGRLIEEINFKGKYVDNYWNEHNEYVSDFKKSVTKYNGKKLFITSANMLINDNIIINIYDYGTIEMNLKNGLGFNTKKYIITGIHDPYPDLKRGLKYCIINNKIYCNVASQIFREVQKSTN